MTVLGVTDPRTWRPVDWAADIIPHLAYAVVAAATIKTESGKGIYRKPLTNARTVELADDVVAILRRRRGAAPTNDIDAVFPTRNGTWQQVTNVERRWRQIRQETELEWVTPDAFRKNAGDIHRRG